MSTSISVKTMLIKLCKLNKWCIVRCKYSKKTLVSIFDSLDKLNLNNEDVCDVTPKRYLTITKQHKPLLTYTIHNEPNITISWKRIYENIMQHIITENVRKTIRETYDSITSDINKMKDSLHKMSKKWSKKTTGENNDNQS